MTFLNVTDIDYAWLMAELGDVCNPALVEEAVSKGLVSVRTDGRLRILNYTAKATHSRSWNAATVACRGLILDDANRIVARPFPKFFGPSEPDAPAVPSGRPMEVTAKLDGSLGIAYTHLGGGVRLATRGSLTSDQAVEATRIWHEKYRHIAIPEGLTPLFEIIYPDNRVVLDYGGMRDLVLIALIDIETGADVGPGGFDWPGPRADAESFADFDALAEHVATASEADHEGYVARFTAGGAGPDIRFKLKYPSYVVAHRAAFGLTTARVWEAAAARAGSRLGVPARTAAARLRLSPETVAGLLGRGDDPVEGLRATLPEEFLTWYDREIADCTARADERIRLYESLARQAAADAGDGSDRAFAAAAHRLAANSGVHPGPIFALRKGRSEARLAIWAQTKPSGPGDRALAATRRGAPGGYTS